MLPEIYDCGLIRQLYTQKGYTKKAAMNFYKSVPKIQDKNLCYMGFFAIIFVDIIQSPVTVLIFVCISAQTGILERKI